MDERLIENVYYYLKLILFIKFSEFGEKLFKNECLFLISNWFIYIVWFVVSLILVVFCIDFLINILIC